MGILIPLILVILCCVIIWRASDGFAIASDFIGRNLSDGVRGATINAIGSSLPELFTSLFFLFYLKDVDGFSGGIGTTAGSAIFNSMIIPAAVILVVVILGIARSINISQKVVRRDGIALIIAEFLFIMIISGQSIDWWHGLFLMLIYFLYLTYMMFAMERRGYDEREQRKKELTDIEYKQIPLWSAILSFDLRRVVLGKKNTLGENQRGSEPIGSSLTFEYVFEVGDTYQMPERLPIEFVIRPDGKVVEFGIDNRHFRSGMLKNCMTKLDKKSCWLSLI